MCARHPRPLRICGPLSHSKSLVGRGPFSSGITQNIVDAIETGNIVVAPKLAFELSRADRRFLTSDCLDNKSKNISFRPGSRALRGTRYQGRERDELLALLRRYCSAACDLLRALLPAYRGHLKTGFTSFRPAEIAGRVTSQRHDDSRLHVDAFPSRPTQGVRILRVLSNVNPATPRIWRVGEPFEAAARRFLPQIRRPLPGMPWLLEALRIVKGRRTEYDYLMLGLHDRMKMDAGYQAQVSQEQVQFPPGATWTCFTDLVSHAAVSGQFALEQTFYLPVSAMNDPALSPLRILQRLAGRTLN